MVMHSSVAVHSGRSAQCMACSLIHSSISCISFDLARYVLFKWFAWKKRTDNRSDNMTSTIFWNSQNNKNDAKELNLCQPVIMIVFSHCLIDCRRSITCILESMIKLLWNMQYHRCDTWFIVNLGEVFSSQCHRLNMAKYEECSLCKTDGTWIKRVFFSPIRVQQSLMCSWMTVALIQPID